MTHGEGSKEALGGNRSGLVLCIYLELANRRLAGPSLLVFMLCVGGVAKGQGEGWGVSHFRIFTYKGCCHQRYIGDPEGRETESLCSGETLGGSEELAVLLKVKVFCLSRRG